MDEQIKDALASFYKLANSFHNLESEQEVEWALEERLETPSIFDFINWIQSYTQTFILHRDGLKPKMSRNHSAAYSAIKRPGASSEHQSKHQIRDEISTQAPIDKINNCEDERDSANTYRCYLWFYSILKIRGHEPHYSRLPFRVYTATILTYSYMWLGSLYSLKVIEFLRIRDRFVCILRPNSWFSRESCAYREDIYYYDLDLKQEALADESYDLSILRRAYNNILSLGEMCIEHSALNAYYMQMACIMVVSSYVSILLSKQTNLLYLNALSFHLFPIEERRRLRQNLIKIFSDLIFNSPSRCHRGGIFSDRLHLDDHQTKRVSGSGRLQSRLLNHHGTMGPTLAIARGDFYNGNKNTCPCSKIDATRRNLTNLIVRENIFKFIKPIHLDAKFYAKQLEFHKKFTIMFVIIFTCWTIFALSTLYINEANSRVSHRVSLLQCKSIHENATILRDVFRMWFDDITVSMLQAYGYYAPTTDANKGKVITRDPQNETNSMFSYLRQFNFELGVMFSSKAAQVIFFIIIGWAVNLIHIYLLTFFFANEFFLVRHWLDGLDKQFGDCIKMLEYFDEIAQIHRNQPGSGIQINHRRTQTKASRLDERIYKLHKYIHQVLLITYSNFELFKGYYRDFKRYAIYWIYSSMLIPIANSAICYYWTSTNLKKHIAYDVNVLWSVNLFFTLALNYYVGCCVALLQRLYRLYSKIDTILAKLVLNSMQLDQIYGLWQRQLMDESEIANTYSIRLFGINSSFGTILGLDTYAVALWLFFASAFGYI